MRLELFFEKFEQFADAPNAVGKMRELVLQLAVQGKLTEQKVDDEPACSLFRRILAKREMLIRERRIRKTALESNPECGEFVIPPAWVWTRLGTVLDVRDGTHDTPTYTDDGYPLITSKNISSGFLSFDTAKNISEADHRQICERSGVDRGDILFAMIGSIGNPVVVDTDREFSIKNVALFKYFDKSDIEQRFLLFYLIYAAESMRAQAAGAVQSFVSLGFLRRYPFPLPPHAEQKRIVGKVDELMALCDRLEAQQQERNTRHAALARVSLARFAEAPTPANLDFLFHNAYTITPADLRKSILTLAVQGNLVPQDPNDEPASALLHRIEERREQLIAAKHFRRSQLHDSEINERFSIPETWEWAHLGNAMLNVTDGFHSTPKATESGVPYVTAKHVKPDLIDFENALFVSSEDFQEISAKTRPTKGDVLVVNIGAGCGWPAVIEVDFEFAFKNVAILNRPNEVDSKYLFNYLLCLRDEIFEERTKGGAQPFLSLGLLREIPFPLPPLAEQRRIVTKVDQFMALVAELENQLTASRATAAKLMEAVVAELTASGKVKVDPLSPLVVSRSLYNLAVWRDRKGVVTPSFVPEGARLVLGNELLARIIDDYGEGKRYQVRQHIVRTVMAVASSKVVGLPLEWDAPQNINDASGVFVAYLMLDALVGNQDRHDENWGLVWLSDRGVFLAPTFDHASSLGRNEADHVRQEMLTSRDKGRSVETYVARAKSALFASPSSTKPLKTLEAFLETAKIRPEAADFWTAKLAILRPDDFRSVLAAVPDTVISAPAREFAQKMLEVNMQRILNTRQSI